MSMLNTLRFGVPPVAMSVPSISNAIVVAFIFIEKGNLRIHYFHGRYGFWAYRFRYQNSDFDLIGYDSSQNRGPVVERSVSINLATNKMRIRENINQNAEGGDEKFKDTWKKFTLSKSIKLREITDFDGLEIQKMGVSGILCKRGLS